MAYDPANPYAGGSSPFDAPRNQAVQRKTAADNSGMDALSRRYAAMGNMNSGSYAKAISDNQRQNQQDYQNTSGNIDMAENQQGINLGEANAQRAFQAGEGAKSRASTEAMHGQSLALQNNQFQQELPLKQKALDQESQSLDMEKQAMVINQQMNQWQMSHSGGLLGSGGFLGTGIGA